MNNRSVVRHSLLALAIGTAAAGAVAQEATPLVESTPAWRLQQQVESRAMTSEQHQINGDVYSAKHLLDADVRGSDGKKLGEVRNFIVGADGRIESVVAATSGFLGIGKSRFVVPWQQAQLSGAELQSLQVPMTKDSIARYTPFDDDGLQLPANSHRGSELVGDWVSLQNGTLLGRVDDLLFDRAGQVQYVVVRGDEHRNGGMYAYPYKARDAATAYVGLPFERPTRDQLMPFDYAQIERNARVASR